MVNWASNPVRGYQPDTDPGDEQPPLGGYTPEPPINQAYKPYPFNMPTQEQIERLITSNICLERAVLRLADLFQDEADELEDKDA